MLKIEERGEDEEKEEIKAAFIAVIYCEQTDVQLVTNSVHMCCTLLLLQ